MTFQTDQQAHYDRAQVAAMYEDQDIARNQCPHSAKCATVPPASRSWRLFADDPRTAFAQYLLREEWPSNKSGPA
jgi:hypothetical protein